MFFYERNCNCPRASFGKEFNPSDSESFRTNHKNVLKLIRCKLVPNQLDSIQDFNLNESEVELIRIQNLARINLD